MAAARSGSDGRWLLPLYHRLADAVGVQLRDAAADCTFIQVWGLGLFRV